MENDTKKEAGEYLQKRFSEMTAAQKINATFSLYFTAKELKSAWLRAQNPELSAARIKELVRKDFLYGD